MIIVSFYMTRSLFLSVCVFLPLICSAWLGVSHAAPFLTTRTYVVAEAQGSVSSRMTRRYCSSRSSVPSFGFGSSHSYQSNRHPHPCPDKSLLNKLVAQNMMTCGSPGWTFPGLIWGDCPITACILRSPQGKFGGDINF